MPLASEHVCTQQQCPLGDLSSNHLDMSVWYYENNVFGSKTATFTMDLTIPLASASSMLTFETVFRLFYCSSIPLNTTFSYEIV